MGELSVLSLFDGMSCAQIAMKRAGIKVDQYFASELDKHAIKVTQANYPGTIQLGDVLQVKAKDLPKIDIVIAGSPCQGFSFAGKQLAFNDPRSKLFFEFVRVWKEVQAINPDAKFLLENVRMKKEHEPVISRYLGVEPIVINSALVSAQNRVRLYWTNIANEPYGFFGDMKCTIPQPEDKGLFLKDILEPEVDQKYYLKDSKIIKFVTDKWRLDKQYTQLNGGKSLPQMSRQYSNWNGDYILTNKQGKVKHDQNKASCFTAGGNSGGNHSDMDLTIHSLQPRNGKGQGGKSYCLDLSANQAIEPMIVASRGRNPENPKNHKSGLNTEQTLESRNDDKTNCLTSVQKDNLVIQVNPSTESGGKQPYQQNRVYDVCGKNPALLSELSSGSNAIQLNKTRIRRLTPLECERLQTVPDNYSSCVSDTQRYKMLGNGFTVDVIAYILSYLCQNPQ